MLELCPCGSGKSYNDCCEPIITGKRKASTAVALMRSRYSAFTIADVDYLMKSWHSKKRNLRDKALIRNWARSVQWMKLEIINATAGLEEDEEGWVSFKAYYIEQGKTERIFEHSYFQKENGRWVYTEGRHE